MKFASLISAGLIAAAAIVPAAASAQQHNRHDRVVVRSVHTERHHVRPRTHRVCKVTYRHHQRVRTCRTVRY